jgi:glycosyltransferase involved in cell wall biosynthesis
MPEVTIIMPVFNERPTVLAAIDQLLEAAPANGNFELLVIDDGSNDGTTELLAERDWPAEVTVTRHPVNRGKGAAIATGLARATGRFTTIMDADLEYRPEDVEVLLEPLRNGEARAVFGARGFQAHSAHSFWYVMGNKGVSLVANVLYNSWLSDIMTCHKAMETELFRSLGLREPGFGIEPEIAARLLRRKVRIFEIPVVYRARVREEGKKLTAIDGFRVVRTLIRCRLSG